MDDSTTLLGVSYLLWVVIGLVFYLLYSGFLYILAGKLRAEHKWFAFVPIANIYLILKMSGRERNTIGKLLLFLVVSCIPFGALVYLAILFMDISMRLDGSSWKGLLAAFPVIGIVFLGWMALSPAEPLQRRQAGTSRPYQRQTPVSAQQQQGMSCSFCGEVSPPGFSECQNCGNPLRADRGKGWK